LVILVLAQACEGIDILSESYIDSLRTSLQAIGNQFDYDEWDGDEMEFARCDNCKIITEDDYDIVKWPDGKFCFKCNKKLKGGRHPNCIYPDDEK
jgi:hypothetical protein